MIAVVALLLAGCASRSLNAPPVVDWSTGAPPATSVSAVPAPRLYTVQRDDTLASIAKKFNVTTADLIAWNGFGPNPRVLPNQVLRVSSPNASPTVVDSASPIAVPQPVGSETVEQRPLGSPPTSPITSSPIPPSTANVPIKNGPLGVKRPYSDAALAELSRPDGDSAATVPVATDTVPVPTTLATTSNVAWSWPAGGKPSVGFADGKSKGIDIPGKPGDAVLAAADGKVTFAGTGVRGYGNFLIVQHTPELLSVYAHNRANLVKEGAVVTKGQKIAEMGNSESDTVKVHFEIRNDSKPVDPLKYLPAR